jgi:hypothetical protein|tara:strand:- start:664 stop:972 length:309 start_codon:yes stop_codon:yes gene_type:complete
MPYTQEELKNLSWYQNLIDEDEQAYLANKDLLETQAALSGSADNGSLLVRDDEGTILIFEDPYTGNLPQDPSTKIIHTSIVNKLKDDEANINSILDRNFEEL